MRILHLSDLHFGYEDGQALVGVQHYVEAQRPDLIVASGDLSAAGLQTELTACAEWLSLLGPPIVATPGNHDAPYFEFLPRFYRPFRRFRRAAMDRMAREWRGSDVWIVTANTARGWQFRLNWALGAISGQQVARLEHALKQAPANALKIVVTHHPLIWPREPALTGQTHGGAKAAHAMVKAGAHLFLAGHLHVMRDVTITEGDRQALAITAGTLCTRLRGDPMGFNVIAVESEDVRIERYGLEDGEAKLRAIRVAKLRQGRLIVDEAAPVDAMAS
jgi:3',5'-cyclic AMP phosphodiesterase CpdA